MAFLHMISLFIFAAAGVFADVDITTSNVNELQEALQAKSELLAQTLESSEKMQKEVSATKKIFTETEAHVRQALVDIETKENELESLSLQMTDIRNARDSLELKVFTMSEDIGNAKHQIEASASEIHRLELLQEWTSKNYSAASSEAAACTKQATVLAMDKVRLQNEQQRLSDSLAESLKVNSGLEGDIANYNETLAETRASLANLTAVKAEDDAKVLAERQSHSEELKKVTERARKSEGKNVASAREVKTLEKELKRIQSHADEHVELATHHEAQHLECTAGHEGTSQALEEAVRDREVCAEKAAALEATLDAPTPLPVLWSQLKASVAVELSKWAAALSVRLHETQSQTLSTLTAAQEDFMVKSARPMLETHLNPHYEWAASEANKHVGPVVDKVKIATTAKYEEHLREHMDKVTGAAAPHYLKLRTFLGSTYALAGSKAEVLLAKAEVVYVTALEALWLNANAAISQVFDWLDHGYEYVVDVAAPYVIGGPENAPLVVDFGILVVVLLVTSRSLGLMLRTLVLVFALIAVLTVGAVRLMLKAALWLTLVLPLRILKFFVWHTPMAAFWHTPKFAVRRLSRSLSRGNVVKGSEGVNDSKAVNDSKIVKDSEMVKDSELMKDSEVVKDPEVAA